MGIIDEYDKGAMGPLRRLVIAEIYQIYQFGAVDPVPDLYPDPSIKQEKK
jgi:hypothetical protein